MTHLPANTNGLRVPGHTPGQARLHAAPASTGHAPHSTVDAGACALLDTLVLVRSCLRPPAEPYPHDEDTQPPTELPIAVCGPEEGSAPLPTEWIPAGVPRSYERMRGALDAVGGGSWSVRRLGDSWTATVAGPRGRYDAIGNDPDGAVDALLRILSLAGLIESPRDTVRPSGLKSSPRAPRSHKKALASVPASDDLHSSRVEPRGPGGGADSHPIRRRGTRVSFGTVGIYIGALLGLWMIAAILQAKAGGLW